MSVFIARYSAGIAENTQIRLIRSTPSAHEFWHSAVMDTHTHTHTHLYRVPSHVGALPPPEQGHWSCQSPTRGNISGPHSRREAPGPGATLGMLSSFPGSCGRNGEAHYYLACRKQTDAKRRMQWKVHMYVCGGGNETLLCTSWTLKSHCPNAALRGKKQDIISLL